MVLDSTSVSFTSYTTIDGGLSIYSNCTIVIYSHRNLSHFTSLPLRCWTRPDLLAGDPHATGTVRSLYPTEISNHASIKPYTERPAYSTNYFDKKEVL